jgi:hypothetical protein
VSSPQPRIRIVMRDSGVLLRMESAALQGQETKEIYGDCSKQKIAGWGTGGLMLSESGRGRAAECRREDAVEGR